MHWDAAPVSCRERSRAWGLGKFQPSGPGGREAWGGMPGFLSFLPLLATVLTPLWPPLSHSGLPAGIFPPAKQEGCFPLLLVDGSSQ